MMPDMRTLAPNYLSQKLGGSLETSRTNGSGFGKTQILTKSHQEISSGQLEKNNHSRKCVKFTQIKIDKKKGVSCEGDICWPT